MSVNKGKGRNGDVTKSLSFRLAFTITSGILITSTLATTGVVWRAIDRQIDDRSIEIRSMAQVLSASLSQAVAERDVGGIYAGLRTIQYSPRITYAQIATEDGTQLAQVGNHVALATADEGSEIGWASQIERMFGRGGLVENVEIRNQGRTVGSLTLAGQIPAARTALLAELKNAAWWAIVAILIGVVMAYRQQRRIIRPIGLLTDVMARVSPDTKLPPRVELDGVGEVAVLVSSYNSMIEQVVQRDNLIAKHTEHLEDTVDTRTRELRVARDDAQQAADAKARFLATMSHEIRTPMNGVLVMAELLARSDLKAEQKGYARVIAKSGETLLDLLNDILDISKFDAADVTLENVPLSPDELANDAIMIFWEQAKAKGVELVASVDAQVPSIITGDPKRLRQCLANLVGNALKFTESGSVAVDISVNQGGKLVLAVTDTGAGIAEDRREAIFEAFEQEDHSTSRTHGGTGLGLAIVSRLVGAMQGDVAVESELGRGSCFSIAIPLQAGEAQVTEPLTAHPTIALMCNEYPALAARLEQQFVSAGAKLTASMDTADCVVALTDNVASLSTARPVIGLWSFGKSEPRELLESGALVDLLSVPYTRAEIHSLLERVIDESYRGIDAIGSSLPTEGLDAPNYASVRVLIADDGAVNRQVLCDALSVYGIDPVVTENGAQAIQAAQQNSFDLIVLDGNMPIVDGYEAAEHIRKNEAAMGSARTGLILFTSDFECSSGDTWQKFGFDGVLSKPFQMAELGRLLARCHDGRASPAKADDPTNLPRPPLTPTDAWIAPSVLETLELLDTKRTGALRRVYDRFLETLPNGIEDLHKALRADDTDAVRRTAHALKSICGSAGAFRLAELAADIEISAAGAIETGSSYRLDTEATAKIEEAVAATTDAVHDLLISHAKKRRSGSDGG